MISYRRDRARLSRFSLIACAASILCGCSSSRNGDWGEVYRMMRQAIGSERVDVPIEQAAAVPFASIGVRVGDSQQGILVLATSTGNEQLWTSSSRIALLTRNGRILRTAGLEHNLTEARNWNGGNGAPPVNQSSSSRWQMDFADLGLNSVFVTCKSIVRGPETIKNFSVAIRTIHVDEECHSDTIDWSYVNSYWIAAATGLTWRSIQYISPKSDPIEIAILRPPAGP